MLDQKYERSRDEPFASALWSPWREPPGYRADRTVAWISPVAIDRVSQLPVPSVEEGGSPEATRGGARHLPGWAARVAMAGTLAPLVAGTLAVLAFRLR